MLGPLRSVAWVLPTRAAPQGDARSVDELLNFIDGEGQREAVKAKQKKKKGKKRGKGAAAEEQALDDAADGAQAASGAATASRRVG